jgi:hypothetical protein
MVQKGKVRVNITVDSELLDKAKTKLDLFGGKLSTLFNAYLKDFVDSVDKRYDENYKNIQSRVEELEKKLQRLEKNGSKRQKQ